MAQINSREIVLLGLTTITTNGTGSDINLPMKYTSAIVTLDILTVSGTTPTLNVYVQTKQALPAAADAAGAMPTGAGYYDDLLSFSQATTSNTRRVFRITGGSNVEAAAGNGTLTAGSARNGPIGSMWNIKWTVGGTTPSFAAQIVAQFIP